MKAGVSRHILRGGAASYSRPENRCYRCGKMVHIVSDRVCFRDGGKRDNRSVSTSKQVC